LTGKDNSFVYYGSSNKKNFPYVFMLYGIFFLQINDEEEGSDTGCDKARGRGPFGDEEEGFRKGITQTNSFSKRFVQKMRSSF
jgi:hypothetical protein